MDFTSKRFTTSTPKSTRKNKYNDNGDSTYGQLMAPTPAKQSKTTPKSVLRTSEGRMFNEKFIFLNKSTSKFVIIGIHPVTFQACLKICDRASGSFVSMTLDNFVQFVRYIRVLLDDPFADENFDNEDEDRILKLFSVESLSKDVWKIAPVDGFGIAVHRLTLENLLESESCIYGEMFRRLCGEDYKKAMDKLRFETVDYSEKAILEQLQKMRIGNEHSSIEYQLAFDLICHHDFFITLQEYNEGFFRRVIF